MRKGRQSAFGLDGAERETLEQWTRRPKTAQALALRARIILSSADGHQQHQGWPPICGYALTRWGNGVPGSWNNGWTACWTNRAAVAPV